MMKIRIILSMLCCMFILAGCYEDEAVIVLNTDGSGSVHQKLHFTERLLVAASDGEVDKNAPPLSEEEMRETIDSALEISKLVVTDQPDGSRIIEMEGTFNSPEQFFLSDYCQKTLSLRLSQTAQGQAVIYCKTWDFSGNGPEPQKLYGLAKGLHVKRSLVIPTKIEKTNGYSSNHVVSWVTDLRNKDGLARTCKFVESEDKGNGYVIFDASALKFSLPLKNDSIANKDTIFPINLTAESNGDLQAEVVSISMNKKIMLEGDSGPEMSDMKVGVKVSWPKEITPYGYNVPVLQSIQDDQGKDLVEDNYESFREFHTNSQSQIIEVKTKVPDTKSRKLLNIQGYCSVVKSVKTEKVVLENLYDLAGKDSTGKETLDKLNFKIKAVQGARLDISVDGGHDSIVALAIFSKEGNERSSRGGGGWGDNYSYDFNDMIARDDKCEIEVVISKDIVKVPFSLDEALFALI